MTSEPLFRIGTLAVVAGTLSCANTPPLPPGPIGETHTTFKKTTFELSALERMQRVATVDERYQSYNVEMAEVIGSNYWKPYDKANGSVDSSGTPAATNGSGPTTTTDTSRSSITPSNASAPMATPSTSSTAAATPSAPAGSSGAALQIGQDPTMFEALPAVDLSTPRLRKLAAALGPAYVRVSGTWANTVYFHDSDDAARPTPPQGFQGVLTRRQWRGVVEFARAVNAKLMTSFTISRGVRDSSGVWTPHQAKQIILYTKSLGGQIDAAEFFDEPTLAVMGGAPAGYDAAAFARDFAVFQPFAKATAPEMIIVGPGSAGENVTLVPGPTIRTEDLLRASPPPTFDVFSYHFYGAPSARCTSIMPGASGTSADAALSEEWLSRTDRVHEFYASLRDRYQPGRPMWVTETADAACGGNRWAATFRDTFRYLDQMGRLAKRGVQAVFHNTLAASDYGLIDHHTQTPRPNYWAALLWKRLMGKTVLEPGTTTSHLHLYAHCLRDRPGGVALLVINTSRTQSESTSLSISGEVYGLRAPDLDGGDVRLNGRDLKLDANEEFPNLKGARVPPGRVEFAPASITFVAVPDAQHNECQ